MKGPDARGWALIGLFALTGAVLIALTINPALSDNTLFDTIATLIVGSGGLLNAIGFYFGSSQNSARKDETIATMATTASTQPQVQPPLDPKPLTDPFVIKE
jgi:hypothetical protein